MEDPELAMDDYPFALEGDGNKGGDAEGLARFVVLFWTK